MVIVYGWVCCDSWPLKVKVQGFVHHYENWVRAYVFLESEDPMNIVSLCFLRKWRPNEYCVIVAMFQDHAPPALHMTMYEWLWIW